MLAQTFKTMDEAGHVIGGPVYYIRAVFKGTFGKLLAGFFALAIIFALGFTGNMVQSNAISNAFQKALGVPTWVVGILLAVVAAFIFLGGVTRIDVYKRQAGSGPLRDQPQLHRAAGGGLGLWPGPRASGYTGDL